MRKRVRYDRLPAVDSIESGEEPVVEVVDASATIAEDQWNPDGKEGATQEESIAATVSRLNEGTPDLTEDHFVSEVTAHEDIAGSAMLSQEDLNDLEDANNSTDEDIDIDSTAIEGFSHCSLQSWEEVQALSDAMQPS